MRGWEEGALGEVRLDGAPGLGRGRVAPVLLSVGRELLVGPEHPPVCPAPSNCCCALPRAELAFRRGVQGARLWGTVGGGGHTAEEREWGSEGALPCPLSGWAGPCCLSLPFSRCPQMWGSGFQETHLQAVWLG